MLVGCGELPLEAAPSHASARYGAMRAPFGSRTLASLGDRVEIESVPSGPLAVLCCTRAGPRAARAPRTPRRAVDEQCVCVCGVSCLSVCTKDRRERGVGRGAPPRQPARRRRGAEGGTRPRGVFGRVYRGERRGRTPGTTHMCDILPHPRWNTGREASEINRPRENSAHATR